MTTWSLAGRESLLSILGRKLARSRLLTVAVARLVFRFLLVVAGLGWLCVAAWGVDWRVGAACIGVSCLLLEWAVKR